MSLAARELRDPDRLLSTPFTLLELRRLDQAVLGRSLPKDTFRRSIQPRLRSTERYQVGEVGNPARLFRHLRARPGREPELSQAGRQ